MKASFQNVIAVLAEDLGLLQQELVNVATEKEHLDARYLETEARLQEVEKIRRYLVERGQREGD